MTKLFLIALFFVPVSAKSQDTVALTLNFDLKYGNDSLKLSTYYPYNKKDSLNITAFRFYISKVELMLKRKVIFAESDSYHLIDAEIIESQHPVVDIPADISFDGIRFYLGIDSLTNVSGVKGGDLDPTKGMYWTWQSGYINFKIEGKSNVSKARNNEFEYHLGGYLKPHSALRTIILPIGSRDPVISFDVQKMFSAIDINAFDHIMSPGDKSVVLSLLVAKLFQLL